MGPKIWKNQYFKNREIWKAWTDSCPPGWVLCLCLWGCAFPARALSQPTPAPETSKETAADRKCSLDLYGDWAAMSEQPDECSVIDLRTWGPPDAAGKGVWGVLCRPTLNLMQLSCKEGEQVRWGQAVVHSSPRPCKKRGMPCRRIWISGFPASLPRATLSSTLNPLITVLCCIFS